MHFRRLTVSTSSASTRPGFSLTEIAMVAALLASMFALLMPTLRQLKRVRKPQQAAAVLQGRLAACRVHALSFGRPYDFHFEPDGRKYLILPSPPETGSHAQPSSRQAASSDRKPLIYWGELPEGLRFDSQSNLGESGQIAPSRWPVSPELDSAWKRVAWSSPIRFYPDGQATNAYVTLMDDDGRLARLQVLQPIGRVRTVAVQSKR